MAKKRPIQTPSPMKERVVTVAIRASTLAALQAEHLAATEPLCSLSFRAWLDLRLRQRHLPLAGK